MRIITNHMDIQFIGYIDILYFIVIIAHYVGY